VCIQVLILVYYLLTQRCVINNIYFCLNQILKSGSFFFFQNRETNHQRLQILRKKTLLTKIFICSERRGKDLGEEKRLLQCVM